MRFIGAIFTIVLVVCVLAAIFVMYRQTNIAESIRITSEKGVDCSEFVSIGGIRQYLYQRGDNTDNPVMLFLHGGPGSPELPMLYAFQRSWEKSVTVVHWDQRGCGKTWFENDPALITPTVTYEQLLSDTRDVVTYLQKKFNKDKIIIMGHSWGTVLGSGFVKAYPELVQAYIAVGTVVSFRENERVGYERVLEAAERAGDQASWKKLTALAPYPAPEFSSEVMQQIAEVRKYQMKYKLATKMSDMAKLVIVSPLYTLKEKTFYMNSEAMKGQRQLYEYLYDFDLEKLGTDYAVPVFYIHGEDDWQTPYPLAKDFFNKIETPSKRFYSIPAAGHFTMFDQKNMFTDSLFDILKRI